MPIEFGTPLLRDTALRGTPYIRYWFLKARVPKIALVRPMLSYCTYIQVTELWVCDLA